MTVSMFDAYMERAELTRTLRIRDMSGATIYAQVTQEGRKDLWNSWSQTITRVNTQMLQKVQTVSKQAESLITWNGQPMDRKSIVRQFRGFFGARAVR